MTNSSGLKEAALIEYLDECSEMLERFSKNLSLIESAAANPDTLAAIYRDMHTIKGSSQLFGFNQVAQLAHAMESCLDPVRKGQMQATPALIDILYAGSDIITTLLKGIRHTQEEPDLRGRISGLIPRLVEIAEIAATGSMPTTPDKTPPSDIKSESKDVEHPAPVATSSKEADIMTLPNHKEGAIVEDVNKTVTENPGFGFFDDEPVSPQRIPISPEIPAADTTRDGPNNASPSSAIPSDMATKPITDDGPAETIRVHVSLLDNLMNLVGELVLIRNQLLQHAKVSDSDTEFAKMSQRLNGLTAELQNEVMKTRMQPVGSVINKFSRVVRDMGRDLGKKIELHIEGADTELDKTIIESVKDPLTHIIRNAIDHGIESSSERKASGKPEASSISIKAQHESGQVIIEVTDDGRGLDRERIGRKAVEKGLLTNDVLAKLTDREVQSLIFSPGFSTAASVSSISGRGVGMDVVKTNVERIGGVVDLTSVPGKGTTIKLKIPLTLAIVPALIVRAMGQRFAIPQSKLVELVRIDHEDDASEEKIESLQGSPVLRLRGRILPLIHLSQVLTKADQSVPSNPTLKQEDLSTSIVVLNADSFQFGLIVEAVEDTADIVVKALSSFLKELTHFSGATILGDGSVALTIDVMGISANVRATGQTESSLKSSLDGTQILRSKHQMDTAEFLLVDVGAPGSYAIPLTVVSRLEEFDADEFELSGEQKVVRYRESLLPIFSLPDFLHLPFASHHGEATKTPVVVIRRGDNLYGVAVQQIQDVVALPSQIDQTVRDRPGILGTMISNDRVLVVVDIFGMIDAVKSKLSSASGAANEYIENENLEAIAARHRGHRILVAEDSSFFRNYIKQVLTEVGFKVETACDGAEAWSTLESTTPEYYSLVLSDIEMPVMDGLELASKVSSDHRFKNTPLIAITTRFSNADIERGQKAGFNRYIEKLNPEKLIATIDEVLTSRKNYKESKRASNE